MVHAGDSRCYLMRGARLQQITDDHTLAQQMVDGGAMDRADAEDSRFSHIVVNALVASKSTELDPEVRRVDLAPGDQLLLCSDGLTGPVADETIAKVLQHAPTAELACQQLVAQANAAGGPDNTTVVVARFLQPQEQHGAAH